MIAGKSFDYWAGLFHFCYEYRYDGGRAAAKRKDKEYRTGYYTRVCLPYPGCLLEQDHLTMEIFTVMRNHYTAKDFKKYK